MKSKKADIDTEIRQYIYSHKRGVLCAPRLDAMAGCEKRDNCLERMEYLIDCHTSVVLQSETKCKKQFDQVHECFRAKMEQSKDLQKAKLKCIQELDIFTNCQI